MPEDARRLQEDKRAAHHADHCAQEEEELVDSLEPWKLVEVCTNAFRRELSTGTEYLKDGICPRSTLSANPMEILRRARIDKSPCQS